MTGGGVSERIGVEFAGCALPGVTGRGERLLERGLAGSGAAGEPLRHVGPRPARAGRTVPWPSWVPPAVRSALVDRGIARPWSHQAQAAELARAGRDVVGAAGAAA